MNLVGTWITEKKVGREHQDES